MCFVTGLVIDFGRLRVARFIFSTSLRAIQNLIPVFGPGFAPGHVTPAHRAWFAGKALFVALERGLHRDILTASCKPAQVDLIMSLVPPTLNKQL
jgi:hypothetical protein